MLPKNDSIVASKTSAVFFDRVADGGVLGAMPPLSKRPTTASSVVRDTNRQALTWDGCRSCCGSPEDDDAGDAIAEHSRTAALAGREYLAAKASGRGLADIWARQPLPRPQDLAGMRPQETHRSAAIVAEQAHFAPTAPLWHPMRPLGNIFKGSSGGRVAINSLNFDL